MNMNKIKNIYIHNDVPKIFWIYDCSEIFIMFYGFLVCLKFEYDYSLIVLILDCVFNDL